MQWFESWFDSPYYHILYKHRSDSEAELFIDNLYTRLQIKPEHTILDLACGKGRHSLYIARKGNSVIGIDLAPNSISEAKKNALTANLFDKVWFDVMDMRDFHLEMKFDFILNLFTSFGYFEKKKDNSKVIQSIAKHQSNGGIVVIDYLNSELVKQTGEVFEEKIIDGIEFHTHKYIDGSQVIKEIKVYDPAIQEIPEFYESVQLFETNEIANMLNENQYQVIAVYGDYDLNPYSVSSPRSITVAKKMTITIDGHSYY